MKKRDAKQVRRIAESLPVMHEQDHVKRYFSCSWKDLPAGWKLMYRKKAGFTEGDLNDCPDPERTHWRIPRLVPISHYRRAKKAYEDGGAEAVMDYIKKVRREYPDYQRWLLQLI